MKNIYIYCEGQTEEAFVNEVLAPYFQNQSIYVTPIICTTKRTAAAKYKGGVSDYNKIRTELTLLCKQHKNEFITTMFDYYAMPDNTPMISCTEINLYKRMGIIEEAINKDIGQPNCFFNFMLHEFEGLLFSSGSSFSLIASKDVVEEIQCMRDEAISPEHINNSLETAPSKRLERLIPGYAKVRNGVLIAKDIGMDAMLRECKHFSEWITKIKETARS